MEKNEQCYHKDSLGECWERRAQQTQNTKAIQKDHLGRTLKRPLWQTAFEY